MELADEKIKIVSFSKFRKYKNTTIEFLWFEYRWKISRKGKDFIYKRISRSKLRKSLKAIEVKRGILSDSVY